MKRPSLTTARHQRGGVTGKGFQPGQSGNPGGRPKGIASLVRQRIGEDGARLVDALALIAFGPPAERNVFFGEAVKVTPRDRLTALQEIADRGWGRPLVVDSSNEGNPQPTRVEFVIIEDARRSGRHE